MPHARRHRRKWFGPIVGIVTLAVGLGLWRINPAIRATAMIIFVINIVVAAPSALGEGTQWSVFSSAFLSPPIRTSDTESVDRRS